jgi:hypothetical protein
MSRPSWRCSEYGVAPNEDPDDSLLLVTRKIELRHSQIQIRPEGQGDDDIYEESAMSRERVLSW